MRERGKNMEKVHMYVWVVKLGDHKRFKGFLCVYFFFLNTYCIYIVASVRKAVGK